MKQTQHFLCRASAYARCSSVTQLKQRHPQLCPFCASCNYSASRQQKPRPGLEAQRVARHKPQGHEDTGVARATRRLRGARRWVSCAGAGSAYGASEGSAADALLGSWGPYALHGVTSPASLPSTRHTAAETLLPLDREGLFK